MDLKLIKKFCSYNTIELENILMKYLIDKKYIPINNKGNYIIAEGELPICLVAHTDTVFKYFINDFYYDNQRNVLWNPYGGGFDDRAGIYAITQLLNFGYKPSIIFTNKEESGGIGAQTLINDYKECPFLNCKAIIELDRANKKDAIYYDCNNLNFEKYINNFGFTTDWGTFSDISIIAPQWGIAAVNLSIGYEDEHSHTERLHCDWCDSTINKIKEILKYSAEMPSFSYIKKDYTNTFPSYFFKDSCIICEKILSDDNQKKIIRADDGTLFTLCEECFNKYYGNIDF